MSTVSLDHLQRAVEGGFVQADHGARTRLSRLRPGDEVLFYSPRTRLRGGDPVQRFTGWATVTGCEPYQVAVSEAFRPWRLAASFHPWVPVDAKALVGRLSFVTDGEHWGLPFRRGLFAVPHADFATIRAEGGQGGVDGGGYEY